MKTKLFIIFMLAAGVLGSYAQQIVTPFTPRTLNSDGTKSHVLPQKNYRNLAATLGYGYGGVQLTNWYANKIARSFSQSGYQLEGVRNSRVGTFFVGFSFEPNPWIEVNIPLLVSYAEGNFATNPAIGQYADPSYRDVWYTLMPNARINWMRNNWVSLYSRVGIGAGILQRFERLDMQMNSRFAFAWHGSPIGAEFGTGIVNFFIEGGYGYLGTVSGGLKFKFTGRTKDMYDF